MRAVSEIQQVHCKCPDTPSKSKSSSRRSDKFPTITDKIKKISKKIEMAGGGVGNYSAVLDEAITKRQGKTARYQQNFRITKSPIY